MEMASSQVEIASSSTFGFVLRDHSRHEKCGRDNDNVKAVHAAFEKNLKILVRDHLNHCSISAFDSQDDSSDKVDEKIENDDNTNNDARCREFPGCSSKSRILDRLPARTGEIGKQSQESQILPQISSDSNQLLPSSPNESGPDQFCHPDQNKNPSVNETLGASSLVQIWEARLHHPSNPSTSQSQAQSNNRTSSGLSLAENSCSESLNEDFVQESEVIQLVDDGNNNNETDCDLQSDRTSVSDLGEKEWERLRVMDIIRRLSNESETASSNNNDNNNNTSNNNNGSGNNNEVPTIEPRCFPQVACSPRIRGRQAFADLLMQIVRDRQRELVWLSERRAVSKFTHRGRLQSMLRIRCLERCTAIQDKHRPKSAVPDVNRFPLGSGMTHPREKLKTNSENSFVAQADAVANVNSTMEPGSLSCFISSRVNKDDHLEASRGGQPEASRGGKLEVNTATQLKACLAKDIMPQKVVDTQERAAEMGCLLVQETVGKNVSQDVAEKSDLRETWEKISVVEIAKTPVVREIEDNKTVLRTLVQKTIQQESTERGRPQETATRTSSQENAEKAVSTETARKSVSKETADENISKGIAEKLNLWKTDKANLQKSEEKTNGQKTMERTSPREPEEKDKTKGKANSQITEKKASSWKSEEETKLHETAKEIINSNTAKRSSSLRETVEKITLQEAVTRRESSTATTLGNSAKKERTETQEDNFAEDGSPEIEDKHNPQKPELGTCLRKSVGEERKDREEEETLRNTEGEKVKEKRSSQDDVEMGLEITASRNPDDKISVKEVEDKETQKQQRQELWGNLESSTASFVLLDSEETSEAMKFPNGCNETKVAEEDEDDEDEQYANYDQYYVENTYDWFNDISRPRSYWEGIRKQWYLEVLNADLEKVEIRELLERQTVSNFLSSDLREKIDRLMISRVQRRLDIESNSEEELNKQWMVADLSGDQVNQEKQEESKSKQEKANQEEQETYEQEQDREQEQEHNQCHEAASDGFSQSSSPMSGPSMMMTWSFRDQDVCDDQDPVTFPTHPISSPSNQSRRSSFPTNQDTSSEMQLICDLKGQMEQLQREMIELRNSIKSCIDMQLHLQKSVNQGTPSVANQGEDIKNPRKRKCCICYEMPVDSLLYRCGHICTCLKCAHELQWSSRKCPICLAPIVDVVRAFLDS